MVISFPVDSPSKFAFFLLILLICMMNDLKVYNISLFYLRKFISISRVAKFYEFTHKAAFFKTFTKNSFLHQT